MHAAHATNSSKAPASVTSKRESLAGRQTKTVQSVCQGNLKEWQSRTSICDQSKHNGRVHTSNNQPLCRGRTSGHVHFPKGSHRRHNHRTKTSNTCIYKAISQDCGHARSHKCHHINAMQCTRNKNNKKLYEWADEVMRAIQTIWMSAYKQLPASVQRKTSGQVHLPNRRQRRRKH